MATAEELSLEVSGLAAHVAVHRFSHGIAGGGLRFSPSVTLPELRRLARTMSYKWALLGLPFGGCKLGIAGDPNSEDKPTILRRFAQKAKGFLHNRIFTGPDMGTSPRDMRPIFRELGQDSYDVVCDRLRAQGYTPTSKDSYRRILRTIQHDVTGVAVAHATKTAWERLEGSLAGTRVSLQGFGSVGKAAAFEIRRLGATVVCIADAEGTLQNPDGLDLASLVGVREGIMNRSRLARGVKKSSREDWLDVEADILIPAAVADAINWSNVHMVQGKMVVEAANIPVPPDVEAHLHEAGVWVLPDFVVNGGLAGAFGALLVREWDSAQAVFEDVIRRIAAATSEVLEEAKSAGRNPRETAEDIAASRLSP